MKVTDLHIIEDEGTRVLLGGTSEDGRKVSFHVTLTSERGIELVNRVREEPETVEVTLPAPKGVEHEWLDKIAEGNLPTSEQCEQCGVALFTDEVDDKRCREHRDG